MIRRALAAIVLVSGCTDVEPYTSPTAHETPPLPPPPLETMSRSAYLGGSGYDTIDDVALGTDGTIYVVGGTRSADFPVTDASTLDPSTPAGCSRCPFDGFVAAIGPDGVPRWVRLIGSPGYDRLTAVAQVGQTLFVAGSTGERPGMPGWHGGADPTGELGEQDGLLCALDTDTGTVQACRYLGGDGPMGVGDLALNSGGNRLGVAMLVFAGEDLHLDPAYRDAFTDRHRATAAGSDVVVMSLTTDLLAADNLRWASYVGGSGDEHGTPSLAIRGDVVTPDRFFVLTDTTSADAPTPGGFATTLPSDGQAAYYARLEDEGTRLAYGSYLGGSAHDHVGPNSIADGIEAVFVGLTTQSLDMPVPGGAQTVHAGSGGCGDGGDVWIGRIIEGASGDGSLSASYLGGTEAEQLLAVTPSRDIAGNGRVMVTGLTYSSDFPVARAAQPLRAGGPCATNPTPDAFAANLTLNGVPADATYLGGADFDRGTAIATTFANRTVVVGSTSSTDFPVSGRGDLDVNGGSDGFITEYGPLPPVPPTDGGTNPALDGSPPVNGDAGEPYTEEGGFCVCGAGGSPAGALAPLLGLALVLFRRRRPR